MNAVHFPHLDSITQMASFAWSDEERRVTLESFFYIRLQVCLSKKERFLFGVSVFGISQSDYFKGIEIPSKELF
jgi:hypothetical protein